MANLPRTALALGVALAAACGIPKEKYQAAISESGRLKADLDAESQRARNLEAGLAESSGKLAACEDRAVATEKSRIQLAEEKSQLEKKSAEYEALSKSLSGEIQAGRIQISELQGKMTVRLAEKVLFPSGSATLNRDGKGTLGKVADAFKDLKDRIVRVEGHTDDVPIRSAAFPSNWELSAARAIAVVRFLQSAGVDPSRLAAAGYGEFQPIAPNDAAEGRAQNRRIEISLAAR